MVKGDARCSARADIKVANIHLMSQGKRWKAYLRLFEQDGYDCKDVSSAMRKMHELLNAPPPEST